MSRVFIGLGSNLGNREEYLFAALQHISEDKLNRTVGISPIYETEPVGVFDQPFFLNAVVEIETSWQPVALLNRLLEIEMKLGRQRLRKWGPRTIDLDILLFNDLCRSEPRLTVPHPGLTERRFVLQPLFVLAPDLIVPGLNTTVRELLENCHDLSAVTEYSPKQINWSLSSFR